MQNNGALGYFILGLVILVLTILGVFVFQLNNIEERFIAHHASRADDWKREKMERLLLLLRGER